MSDSVHPEDVTIDTGIAASSADHPTVDPQITLDIISSARSDSSPFPQIDGYRITGKLGEGGMGVVWKAIQISAQRPVALKLASAASFGSDRARMRFQREVELTARLEHPNIARVYDGGQSHGICFYAMELIDGVPLDQYVKSSKAARRQILELMTTVCRAVEHAHQKAILHRDLKPANILVDQGGQPHVLDFGLAKAMEGDQQLSMDGAIAGTPAFMSPEQAAGRTDHLDTRSDVYTLGVILFNLLTGKFPHDLNGSYLDVMKRIAELDPKRLKDIEPRPDKDLEAILTKTLSPDPDRRYGTAGTLAADLERYLTGDPIEAQPPTVSYLLMKRMKKHRFPLAVAAAVLALLLGTGVWAYVRVTEERNAAITANIEKEKQRQEAVGQRKQAEANGRETEVRLAEGLVSQGDAAALSDRMFEAQATYQDAYKSLCQLGASPFKAEAALVSLYAASPPALLTLRGHTARVRCVALSSDGRIALSGGDDNTLRLWDLQSGRTIRLLNGHKDAVSDVAISPDGRTGISASLDKTLKLWELQTGQVIRTLEGHTDIVTCVALSADMRTALSGSDDKTVKLWNLQTGSLIRTFVGHTDHVECVVLSPDGLTAVSASLDKTLKVWNLQTGREIRTLVGHTESVRRVALSLDGRTALSASYDGTLKLWDLKSGFEVRTFEGHTWVVNGVALCPDGRTAVSGGGDHTVKSWDLQNGREIRTFQGHTNDVWNVAVTPDGQTAVSASADGTLKLWDLWAGRDIRTLREHTAGITSVALGRDGRMALSGSKDRTLKLWDIETGHVLRTFQGHTADVISVALSSDSRTALSGSADTTLKLWNLETGGEIRTLSGHTAGVTTVAMSPDGLRALSASPDGALKLWNLNTGLEIRTIQGQSDGHAVSLDCRAALSENKDFALTLWDLEAGREIRSLPRSAEQIWGLAMGVDGLSALSGCRDHSITLWDLETGREVRSFVGHAGAVAAVALSPDGRIALSGSRDQTVRLWDLQTGRQIRTLQGHTGLVSCVALSPDGRTAVSGSWDTTLRVWDFARAATYSAFETTVPRAEQTLQQNPNDAKALALLGNWYAFRGKDDWAVELLEKARAVGGVIDALTLGRCYWELSDNLPAKTALTREACLAAAAREFKVALATITDRQEEFYLGLCLSAVQHAETLPASIPSPG